MRGGADQGLTYDRKHLTVQLEVGRCSDVTEIVGVGDRRVGSAGHELGLDVAAVAARRDREVEGEVLQITAAPHNVFERRQVSVHLWVERVEVINVVHAAEQLVQEKG